VARITVSLNQLFGSNGEQTELGDLIPDPGTEAPEDELERRRRQRLLRQLLGDLPERERLILDHHYGLTGEPRTLNEIGHELGLTRERVRQLEAHAIATLSGSAELLEWR
jgi:RNA polymerase sigma factor (sigma-70 family)